jgi:hypothetical protein
VARARADGARSPARPAPMPTSPPAHAARAASALLLALLAASPAPAQEFRPAVTFLHLNDV